MPSPFPGMDPYLESRFLWRGFHQAFMYNCHAALNAQLPEDLVAVLEERLYVIPEERYFYPDMAIVRRPVANLPPNIRNNPASGTAVLEPEADLSNLPREITVFEEEVREPFIEIVEARNREKVITTIELLSPVNKQAGGTGRSEYTRKRDELLKSDTHLIEIDLLRGGAYTVAIPAERVQEEFGFWDYVICLHRARPEQEPPRRYTVWAGTMRQKLPTIFVPLTPENSDLPLDLQAAMNTTYDAGAFNRRIDYTTPPNPSLTDENRDWADALLRTAGIRR